MRAGHGGNEKQGEGTGWPRGTGKAGPAQKGRRGPRGVESREGVPWASPGARRAGTFLLIMLFSQYRCTCKGRDARE